MSTEFEVYPTSRLDVTFGEVTAECERVVAEYLAKHAINDAITIKLKSEIIHPKTSKRLTPSPSDTFRWQYPHYGWFSFGFVGGGTDAYCEPIRDENDEIDKWWVLDELRAAPAYSENLESCLRATKRLNLYWRFRRSAGQHALTNLCYGLLAASVAKLTHGLIHSSDSAWEYEIFPCHSEQFLERYFVPENTNNADKIWWANQCLDVIRSLKD